MRKKIGIFSGTFDPVHTGHIAFTIAAKEKFLLDEVLLMPEQLPRQKQNVTSIVHRKQMLVIAAQSYPDIHVITLNDDKQFTIKKTLPKLYKIRPGAQFVFLCGSDVVRTFTYRWEGLAEFLETTEVIVGLRGQDTANEVHEIFMSLGIKSKYEIIESPKHQTSSAKFRSRSSQLQDISPLVAEYIAKNDLYS